MPTTRPRPSRTSEPLRGLAVPLLLVIAAVAASCGETVGPDDQRLHPEVGPVLSAAGPTGPELVPNGVPYRNPEYRHATGRSGGAELTARALMNLDGTVDLEATTGELDSGDPPPHAFTKVQVKPLDFEGEALEVHNYNHVDGGSVAYSYEGLLRHGMVQVQGSVRVPNASGKGSRTGVVTVLERVNLRPDLSVEALNGASEAFVNTTVQFTADIAELNGDVPGTADCVFYVGGVEAARSDGIWVGEGDVVSCTMMHLFEEVGTFPVEVVVEQVVPGDWNSANNRASVDITIVDPVVALSGEASAEERHEKRITVTSECQTDSNFKYCRHVEKEVRTDLASASFYGAAATPLTFPADIAVTLSTDGTVFDEVVRSGVNSAYRCKLVKSQKGTRVETCRNATSTWVNIWTTSGEVTYLTDRRDWGYICEGPFRCDSWDRDTYYHSVTKHGDGSYALGDDFTFDVRIQGSEHRFEAAVTVPLARIRPTYWEHFSCGANCAGKVRTLGGKAGTTSF